MDYKKRLLGKKLNQLVQHFPVVVISGARQVGKSTLLKEHFPNWENIVFDPVVDIGNARTDPELFLRNHPTPLILDEIQYCSELVPSKQLWKTLRAQGVFYGEKYSFWISVDCDAIIRRRFL